MVVVVVVIVFEVKTKFLSEKREMLEVLKLRHHPETQLED